MTSCGSDLEAAEDRRAERTRRWRALRPVHQRGESRLSEAGLRGCRRRNGPYTVQSGADPKVREIASAFDHDCRVMSSAAAWERALEQRFPFCYAVQGPCIPTRHLSCMLRRPAVDLADDESWRRGTDVVVPLLDPTIRQGSVVFWHTHRSYAQRSGGVRTGRRGRASRENAEPTNSRPRPPRRRPDGQSWEISALEGSLRVRSGAGYSVRNCFCGCGAQLFRCARRRSQLCSPGIKSKRGL